MLVPCGHVVFAIAALHDAVVDELRDLEGGTNGRGGGWGLEEGAGQVGGLEDALADDFTAVEPLLGVDLAGPASTPEGILHPQIGLVADFERVQLGVLEVVDSSLGNGDNVVGPVVVHVGHVQAKSDGRVLGQAVKGIHIAGADDHRVGGDGALGLGVLVRGPSVLLLARVPYHVVLGVAS